MWNEEHRVERGIEAVSDWLRSASYTSELVLIDDGSTDRTHSRLYDAAQRACGGNLVSANIHVHEKNQGKGAAIRTGLGLGAGDWFLLTDIDMSTPISEVEKLLARARKDQAALVAGSRSVRGAKVSCLPHRFLAGRIFQLAARKNGLGWLKDSQCGFKLVRQDLAERLHSALEETGYLFDLEMVGLAMRWGFGVAEEGVVWKHQNGSKVNLLRDGARMWKDLERLGKKFASG